MNEIDPKKFNFLDIDVPGIHDEWISQPRKYFEVSVEQAKARRDMDEAKANIDVTAAELDETIRDNPEKYGVLKVSEAAIKAAILRHPYHVKAQVRYGEAKFNYDIWSSAVEAMQQKKYALQNIVDLELGGIHAEPKSRPQNREVVEEATKKMQFAKINDKLNKKGK